MKRLLTAILILFSVATMAQISGGGVTIDSVVQQNMANANLTLTGARLHDLSSNSWTLQYSTDNDLEYGSGNIIITSDQRDTKMLQGRNELNDIGIWQFFQDVNGNGGMSVDSANGQTITKIRGAPSDHSYLNNKYVSVGRGGQSQEYGGTVDGALFTVSGNLNPLAGTGDAENYQMIVQNSGDVTGEAAGIAFTNENATGDRSVGAGIIHTKAGNWGYGSLSTYLRNSGTSALSPLVRISHHSNDSTYLEQNHVIVENELNVQGSVSGVIMSGTYSPTVTDSLNMDASNLLNITYQRVNNIVKVDAVLQWNVTSTSGKSIVEVSLPVASDLDTTFDLFGHGTHLNSTDATEYGTAIVIANTGDNTAYIIADTSNDGNQIMLVHFCYEVK